MISLIAISAVLAVVTIWSRKETRARMLAVLIFVLFVPLAFFTEQQILGHARECNIKVQSEILGYKIDEPLIYIMTDEPLLCHMPYSDKKAEDLQQERQEGNRLVIYPNEIIELELPRGLPEKQ